MKVSIKIFVLSLLAPVCTQAHRFEKIKIFPHQEKLLLEKHNWDALGISGETSIIKDVIQSGDTVVEAGFHKGRWSSALLQAHNDVVLYAFEPGLKNFEAGKNALKKYGNCHVHQATLGNRDGRRLFYDYFTQGSMQSSFYRNLALEDRGITFMLILTPIMKLDTFCAEQKINSIDFLKVDTEGSELEILQGADALLKSNAIKCVQFSYGPAYRNAGVALRQVIELLTRYEYIFFKLSPRGLLNVAEWVDALEDYTPAHFIAVAASELSEVSV